MLVTWAPESKIARTEITPRALLSGRLISAWRNLSPYSTGTTSECCGVDKPTCRHGCANCVCAGAPPGAHGIAAGAAPVHPAGQDAPVANPTAGADSGVDVVVSDPSAAPTCIALCGATEPAPWDCSDDFFCAFDAEVDLVDCSKLPWPPCPWLPPCLPPLPRLPFPERLR